MKLKTIYIAALLAGCTNVNSNDKIVWKAKKDSISHRMVAYPYWYVNRRFVPFTEEEHAQYSRGETVESIRPVSERGGFGEHGMSGHGGAGE